MQRTLSRRPASYSDTGRITCTDKDDDGAVITAAFIACIHSGIAAVKACIQFGSDVRAEYARLIRDVLTLYVATQENDVYRSRKSYRFAFPQIPSQDNCFLQIKRTQQIRKMEKLLI